ncbi:hypothetical protein VKT23_017662 [Stygiomarasmius scandens]|uniref:Integrase catalytic domain-containing protein n=1 Tax=Marasmiellus scandens TaxID=2682957 RepID=A0ABR1IRD9_9AGAR
MDSAEPFPDSQEEPLSMTQEQLVTAFREHHSRFTSVVNRVLTDPGVDMFHLVRLLQDLNEFSAIVEEHGGVLGAEELQTLKLNLQRMKQDVDQHSQSILDASHGGYPQLFTVHSGSRGRPRTMINPFFLAWAYSRRSTASIARFLGVSHSFVRRQLLAYEIASPGSPPQFTQTSQAVDSESVIDESADIGYTLQPDERDELLDPELQIPETLPEDVQQQAASLAGQSSGRSQRSYLSSISDQQLDSLVIRLQVYFPRAGVTTLDGMLRRLGHVLPRERIRQCLIRVSPLHRVFQPIAIRRRGYSVPGPNSLWHHDGQHGLIRWKILIHGFIDGYSRLITALRASNNNRAATVLALFLHAIAAYDRPSRLRGDFGGENVHVAAYMEYNNGRNRGSYIWGQSIHNTRIESLWCDVTVQVTSTWRERFYQLEAEHGMNINNSHHIWLLQHIFLPLINDNLRFFAESWNEHRIRIRGQASRSPSDMFFFDMIALGMRGQEISLPEEELEVFGIDWDSYADDDILNSHYDNNLPGQQSATGGMPSREQLSYVEVEPPDQVLTEEQIEQIDTVVSQRIRPGVDLTDDVLFDAWSFGLAQARLLSPGSF